MKATENLMIRLSLAIGIIGGALMTGSANNALPWLVAILIFIFALVMFFRSKEKK